MARRRDLDTVIAPASSSPFKKPVYSMLRAVQHLAGATTTNMSSSFQSPCPSSSSSTSSGSSQNTTIVKKMPHLDVVGCNYWKSNTTSVSQSQSLSSNRKPQDTISGKSVITNPKEIWRLFRYSLPFLGMPQEIHLVIFSHLDPIDSTSLSLVNKYLWNVVQPLQKYPLDIGAPGSEFPVIRELGCRHCCPVLYSPAHCELHYHLRAFMPKDMRYCGGLCKKYTRSEDKGYSDSKDYCGVCGMYYMKIYQRGRRRIDMVRPGQKPERLPKYYNKDVTTRQ